MNDTADTAMTERDLSPVYEDPDYIDLMDRYEDVYDPRNPWCLGGYPRRDQYVSGLRRLADLLETRHDLPIPKDGSMRLDVIGDDDRRVAEITFGPVRYRFAALPAASVQAAGPRNVGYDAARLAARDTTATSRHAAAGNQPLATAGHTSAQRSQRTQRTQRTNAKPRRRAR